MRVSTSSRSIGASSAGKKRACRRRARPGSRRGRTRRSGPAAPGCRRGRRRRPQDPGPRSAFSLATSAATSPRTSRAFPTTLSRVVETTIFGSACQRRANSKLGRRRRRILVRRLPVDHGVVQPPPAQVRADRAHLLVVEPVQLLARGRPADLAVAPGDEAVERHPHRVDQLAHPTPVSPVTLPYRSGRTVRLWQILGGQLGWRRLSGVSPRR